MKKIFSIVAIVAMMFIASACGNRNNTPAEVEEQVDSVEVVVDSTAVEVLEVAE